jgi:CHAT domain-containing protein/Tfp pilus assembly protein PilF
MLFKSLLVLVCLLSPVFAFAQSFEREIKTEPELISELCRLYQDGKSRELLLRSHPQLVDSRLWRDLNDLAASAYTLSPEQSLPLYEVAIQVAAQLGDQKLLGTTYYNIGRTYSGLNQFPAAIGAYEKSGDHFEQAGLRRDLIYILADLGALYFIREDYERARKYSERSIAIADGVRADSPPGAWPDDFGRARALLTLGEIESRDGDNERAVQKLQESLALYQGLGRGNSSYHLYMERIYSALGRAYPEIGDSARALLYLGKALEIANAQSDTTMIASLDNDIGYLYLEQEDYAQANAQFSESLKIYVALKNQREEARVLMNLGVVDQRRANYDEALRYFRLSVQAATATDIAEVQIAANEGIGVVLTAKRDFHGATEALDKGLAIAKSLSDRTRQTEILWRMAQTNYEMENYTQSTALALNALTLARASHLLKLTYLATTALGESYAAEKKYDLAIETLTQAVGQLEQLRVQVVGREVETQLFLENKVASYHSLADLLMKKGRTLDALLCAEQAKGRVLLDVLRNGKPDLAKVLTPPEERETQRLNRDIAEINDRIKKQETANSSSLKSLYAELDAARLRYQSFQDSLYVAHPDLRLRSGQTPALTVADLNILTSDNDTAYLEYVITEEQVSLFVLTKGKSNGSPEVKFYPLSIKPQDLVRKVTEFHDALAEQRPAYATAAGELYSLLVEPAEQQLRNVGTICIVPDSFLWNLPFQALMTRSEHFLIEDHALYYAPSLSVLREMKQKEFTREKTDSSLLIAFGNPVIGKDEQRDADLCPLPEAEQEVSSIAKSFGPKDSQVFIGREASEKKFKTLAPAYSVIHLATHGVIDNREPLYSHLLLTKTEGDPENDGRLEARQIMDMHFHANLVVLSACETANGKIAPGEGVIGMSWAFFVAGTRSMIVSQWKVNSASTSQLMSAFYENLRTDKNEAARNKAWALRRASLSLLKDQHYRHPFYWSSFVLVGNK